MYKISLKYYINKLFSEENFYRVNLIIVTFLFFVLPIEAQNKSLVNIVSKSGNAAISSIGDVFVDTWANGSKSAFSFTFDDGFMSQYTYAWPVLKQFGFHATFYLIASALTDAAPAIYRYGYWSQFQELLADGNEIGDHTMTHPDLDTCAIGDTVTPGTITYELYRSKQIIEQKIPGSNPLTIAYPYGNYNSNVISIAKKYYQAARSIYGYVQSDTINGDSWYHLIAGNIVFDSTRSLVDDQNKLNDYLNILQNQTINGGQWSILLAHEVFPSDTILYNPPQNSYYPVSVEWLTDLCQWLKQKADSNQIWVETIGNITKYVKERESFAYSVISSSDTSIQINVTDTLDNSIYNYPLTIDVVIPNDWSNVTVQQGDSVSNVTAFSSNGVNYARLHVIPNGGIISLTGSSSNFQISGKVTYNNNANTPLANVMLILKNQNNTFTTTTDSSGNYLFTGLMPGTYNLSAFKKDNWGGVNSTDALMIAKYFAEQIVLDSLQIKAADVDDNGKVNNTDALMIIKRFLNQISSFNIADWIFSTPLNITIENNNVVQNIKGIAAGDVNESY